MVNPQYYFDANALFKYYHLEPSPILVTSDQPMQKVCERISIPFYDPEED